MNHFLPAQETDQVMSKMQVGEMKNVIIKHMFFTAVSNSWYFVIALYILYTYYFIFLYCMNYIKNLYLSL